jgi:hypothetical protein
MKFSLAALARRTRNPRRRAVTFRDIPPPAMFASDLYAACYRPVVALWTQRTDRIMAEYERSLSALTTDSALDLNGILDAIGDEFSRLFLTLTPSLRDWAVKVESWHRGKWVKAALSASDVDLSTILGFGDVQETVEQTIAWNTSLIRDVSAVTRQRVGNAIFDGLKNRTPARDVARTIREAVGMSRDRSQRIAADQLSKITSDLATERRLQAGLSVYSWRHSQKRHPRVRHEDRDGNLYSGDPAMIGREVDGKVVQEEVAREDRPGRPPYCGCRELSVLVFD